VEEVAYTCSQEGWSDGGVGHDMMVDCMGERDFPHYSLEKRYF